MSINLKKLLIEVINCLLSLIAVLRKPFTRKKRELKNILPINEDLKTSDGKNPITGNSPKTVGEVLPTKP